MGVYLHWELPKVYRAAAEVSPGNQRFHEDALLRGFRELKQEHERELKWHTGSFLAETSSPAQLFRAAPNRWLVLRWIDIDSVQPAAARRHVKQFEVFVIESNRSRTISDLGPGIDVEIDVSPFIEAQKDIEDQTEFVNFLRIAVRKAETDMVSEPFWDVN